MRIDGLLGQVRLRIGDQRLTAIITSDALSVLKLRRGDSALAIVKATEVMIAREADAIEVAGKARPEPSQDIGYSSRIYPIYISFQFA